MLGDDLMSRKDSTSLDGVYYRQSHENFTDNFDAYHNDAIELESVVYPYNVDDQPDNWLGYYFIAMTMFIAWVVS